MINVHDASPAFIQIGERVQQLDMLLHIQQFSSLIVLLTGDTQSGKSRLLSSAKSNLSESNQVIFLDGLSAGDQSSLTSHIAQSLSCNESSESIFQEIGDVSQQGDNLHILVDDAQLLTPEALAFLVEIARKNEACHLALCGDNSLQERMLTLQNQLQSESLYHQIDLQPLTEIETTQFISELFKQAGQEIQPLSQKKVHQLWLLSGGIPGKLIELVDIEKQQSKKLISQFPMGHVAAIVLIGTALIFSFLYQDQGLMSDPEDAIALLLEEKNVKEEFAGKSALLPVKGTVKAGVKINKNSVALLGDSKTTPILENSKQSLAAPELTSKLPLKNTLQQLKPMTGPPKHVKKTPKPKPHPLLLAQPSEYVLQLLGVRTEKSAKAFMLRFKRQLNADKLSVYQTQYKGQPWFVVVYGPFNNKHKASKEASALGRTLKSQPWIRPVSKIQEDIRQLRIP